MGIINFTTMKFTVAALLIATTSAVQIQDDCGGKWCNKGLAYDFDEPTRNAAHADKVAKDHAFNGATKAHDESASQQAAANASEAATKAADGAAGAAKADTAAAFAASDYKGGKYPGAEAAKNAAVLAKEGTLDAHLKAFDDKVAREKDQLERGQNQDRSKEVNENTSAKTSEIQGKHDERERANGRLLKAIASF